MSGYNIKELVQEAQFQWLRPAEVLFILQNYEETQLNHEPPQKPPSGSLFLFNKRVLRFFREDGHNWLRNKDGKNVGEAHERLKVGNDEALNCYYAHNEDNPHFWRRCYWMLNPAMEHIVLIHYRDTTIGKHSAGPISASTLGSSNIIQSSNNYATQLASSTHGPSFLDGSPRVLTNSNEASRSILTERIEENNSSPELHIDEALKRIQKQLSLEHVKDNRTFYNENEYLGAFEEFQYGSDNSVSLQYPVLDIAQDQINTSRNGATDFERLNQYQHPLKDEFKVSSQQNYIWKDVLKYDGDAAYDGSLENYMYPSDTNEVLLSQQQTDPVDAKRTLNSISNQNLVVEDYLSHKDAIAAMRNAAQAASRIKAAFRAYSFRRVGLRRFYLDSIDESAEVSNQNLVVEDHLSLKDAVAALRNAAQAASRIQAAFMAHSFKRGGLRGFYLDSIDESADEDNAKVFRKQYSHMLQKYQQEKEGQGNLSHELFYYIQAIRGTHSYSLGQGSSYIHDWNLSHEVGSVSGQAPSIGDMAWDNMSPGSTHSYSHDGSAPSWNDLFKRDSSTTMTESDNLQDISWEEFEQMTIESDYFDF